MFTAVALSAALAGCATLHDSNDAEITAAVRSSLIERAASLAPAVSVQTFHGTVHLSGEVLNDSQRDTLESAARATPGVLATRDDLRVEEDEGG